MRTGAPICGAASARPILYFFLATASDARRSSATSRVAADFGFWTRSQRTRRIGSPSWRMRRTAMGRQFGGLAAGCNSRYRNCMGLAGVVLAAGASARMGRPKALLDFRGRPFDVRILEALEALDVKSRVVVRGPDAGRVRHSLGTTQGFIGA